MFVADQSFAFRLARSVALAAGGVLSGAVAGVAAVGVLFLLPFILSGAILLVVQTFVALAGMVATLTGLWAVLVSFGELGRKASFEVSETSLHFNDLQDSSGAEAKFIEQEIDLATICQVHVDQTWLAKRFGYGDVAIFTNDGFKPAAVLRGIDRPHAFKERLELLARHRAV